MIININVFNRQGSKWKWLLFMLERDYHLIHLILCRLSSQLVSQLWNAFFLRFFFYSNISLDANYTQTNTFSTTFIIMTNFAWELEKFDVNIPIHLMISFRTETCPFTRCWLQTGFIAFSIQSNECKRDQNTKFKNEKKKNTRKTRKLNPKQICSI